ncbi:MAG: ATP-binding protein, partial [Huintestinicola sp.]
EYEPFSLINDLTSIVLTRIGNKDIEFTMDISPTLPRRLMGDNIRIRQILINLLTNAVKFTSKGEVHLKLDCEDRGNGVTLLKAEVSDTGIGIKKDDLSKLFQSFQQVDSKRNRNIEGTGLGLAISQQLLRLMNGSISVDSEYNKGSVFSFELPQKIITDSTDAYVSCEQLSAVVLAENVFVKAQLMRDLEKAGISAYDMDSYPAANGSKPDYIIVERSLVTDNLKDFFANESSVKCIIIDNFNSVLNDSSDNIKIIRKPVYSMNLYPTLGICEEYIREESNSLDDFVFTAPDAKILIVDDNPINLTVAKGLLDPLNMQIDLAGSGAETIKMVKEKKYDLVFMDHMMPEVDGIETTHIIRRLIPTYADVPIIALSANAVSGAKEMFLNEGMNDFVAKPIETKTIVSKLRKWLPQEKIIPAEKNAAPAAQTEAIKIEGLNTESAIKLLGTQKLFMSVLKEYFCSIAGKSAQIQKHFDAEEWKNYTIEVHALKSLSRQIGADELAALAAELEKAGN